MKINFLIRSQIRNDNVETGEEEDEMAEKKRGNAMSETIMMMIDDDDEKKWKRRRKVTIRKRGNEKERNLESFLVKFLRRGKKNKENRKMM